MALSLAAIAGIVTAAGALVGSIGGAVEKKPKTMYRYGNPEADALTSYIPGYRTAGIEKESYQKYYKNTASKILTTVGNVASGVGTALSAVSAAKGSGGDTGSENTSTTTPTTTTPTYKSTGAFEQVRQPGVLEGIQKNMDFGNMYQLPAINRVLSQSDASMSSDQKKSLILDNANKITVDNEPYNIAPESDENIHGEISHSNLYLNKNYSDYWKSIHNLKTKFL